MRLSTSSDTSAAASGLRLKTSWCPDSHQPASTAVCPRIHARVACTHGVTIDSFTRASVSDAPIENELQKPAQMHLTQNRVCHVNLVQGCMHKQFTPISSAIFLDAARFWRLISLASSARLFRFSPAHAHHACGDDVLTAFLVCPLKYKMNKRRVRCTQVQWCSLARRTDQTPSECVRCRNSVHSPAHSLPVRRILCCISENERSTMPDDLCIELRVSGDEQHDISQSVQHPAACNA